MGKRFTFFMLVLVLLVWGAADVQAESGGWFPFQADVCQTGDLTFRATLTARGEAAIHVGYALDWGFDEFILLKGDLWVTADQPATVDLELPDGMTPNGVTFFYVTQTWEWAYRFTLDDATPDCDQGGGSCAPSTGDLVTFWADAAIYFAPDETAVTEYIIPAGQTARLSDPVYADGQFVGIVWACQAVYVPASMVGLVD